MKLSSDAKKYVAAQVAAAFAGKMKELEAAKEAAFNEENAFYDKVNEAIEKFKKEVVLPKFMKLVGSFGKFSNQVSPDAPVCSLRLSWSKESGKYGNCDVGTDFEDTLRAFAGVGDKYRAAYKAIEELKAEIKSRVSYALCEIEIYGKKDTLETIINQAIELEVEKLAKQEEE